MSPEDARRLATSARSGDVAARNALVESVVHMAWRIAWRYSPRNETFRDEIAHDCLLQLTRYMDRFDPDKSSLSTFAHMICDQTARRAWYLETRQKRVPRRSAEVYDRVDPELKWSALDPRERYIIQEIYLNDRDGQDLADEFGISRERIRQLRNRGLEKLRVASDDGGADAVA